MTLNSYKIPKNRKPKINVQELEAVQGKNIEDVEDWTTLLQDALDQYYVVYLPAGIYNLKQKLFLNPQNKLVGDGLGNTILKCTATKDYATKNLYAIENYVDPEKKSCEIEIRDLTISGATPEGRAAWGGLRLASKAAYNGKPQFILDNLCITTFTGIGLFFDAMESLVSNVHVGLCYNHGIYLTNVANRFIGCTSFSNFFTGFYVATGGNFLMGCKAFLNGRIYRYPNVLTERPVVMDYNNRIIQYAYDGFYITGSTINLASCSSQQNYRDGIRILGNNNTIENMQLFANNVDNENNTQINGCSLSIGGSFNRITGSSKPHNDYWNGAEKATVQILSPEAHDNAVALIVESGSKELLSMIRNLDKAMIFIPPYTSFLQKHTSPFNQVNINGVEMVPSLEMHDLLSSLGSGISYEKSMHLRNYGNYEIKDNALHLFLDDSNSSIKESHNSLIAKETAGVLFTLNFHSQKNELYLEYDCKMDEYDGEFCAVLRIDGWYYKTDKDKVAWSHIYEVENAKLVDNGNPFSDEIHKKICISLKDKYNVKDTVESVYIRLQFMLAKLKTDTKNISHSGVFKNIRYHIE